MRPITVCGKQMKNPDSDMIEALLDKIRLQQEIIDTFRVELEISRHKIHKLEDELERIKYRLS